MVTSVNYMSFSILHLCFKTPYYQILKIYCDCSCLVSVDKLSVIFLFVFIKKAECFSVHLVGHYRWLNVQRLSCFFSTGEQPLQVARCTKIINADSDDPKYIINVKQFAKFVVDLGDQVAPTDIEEGMRVG